MKSAATELQKAVLTALSSDVTLAGRMGAVRIHDHAPADVIFPYLTFGRTTVHDWSTDTELGSEHLFTIHAWSKAKGKSEVLALTEAVKSALEDVQSEMDGHLLVNLRFEFEDVRYNEDLSVYHAMVRFRAATEPAA